MRLSTLLAPAALALALAVPAAAQAPPIDCTGSTPRRCVVRSEPTTGNFGVFNRAVAGDTTATGARADLNTVYVLTRGEVYPMNGRLVTNYPLRLEAQGDASAAPPVLLQGVRNDGSSDDRLIYFRDGTTEFSATGIYFLAADELGNPFPSALWIQPNPDDNMTFLADDCVFDYSTLTPLRVNDSVRTIDVRNSIGRNFLNAGSTSNGRFIDIRGGNRVDSIRVVNNTLINSNGNIARLASARPDFLEINHNTVFVTGNSPLFGGGSGQYQSLFVANNLFVDVALRGQPDDQVEPAGVITIVPVDIDGDGMDDVDPADPSIRDEDDVALRDINIRNNNYFNGAEYQQYFENTAFAERAFLGGGDGAANVLFDFYGSLPGNGVEDATNVDPVFANPFGKANYINYVRRIEIDGESGVDVTQAAYDNDGAGEVNVWPFMANGAPLDLSFAPSSPLYTAADGGCPLGDLRWFEDDASVNVAACLAVAMPTDGEFGPGAVTTLALRVGPNPSGGAATARLDLAGPAEVSADVFDTLGRRVASVAPRAMAAGTGQTLTLDLGGLPSGVYVVRVTVGASGTAEVGTARVTVVR